MVVFTTVCGGSGAFGADVSDQQGDQAIDFTKQVRPIFAKHCFKCHGRIKQKSGLRLDMKADALRGCAPSLSGRGLMARSKLSMSPIPTVWGPAFLAISLCLTSLSASAVPLFVNPSFETGNNAGWTVINDFFGVSNWSGISSPSIPAMDGTYVVWFGATDNTSSKS